jgi:hypothetical protein
MNRYYRRLIARGIIPAGLGLRSDDGHPSGGGGEGAGDDGAANDQDGSTTNDDHGQDGDGAPKGNATDWEAAAKKWEKLAKQNKNATEKLAKLEAAAMSEQEKAVAAAKAEGHAEAMKAAGTRLAAAELKSAAKDKGLNLAKVQEFLKVDAFVDENGDVDSKAIEKAVAAFAEVAPPAAPGKSGAPLPGGSGSRPNTTTSLNAAVAARYGQ